MPAKRKSKQGKQTSKLSAHKKRRTETTDANSEDGSTSKQTLLDKMCVPGKLHLLAHRPYHTCKRNLCIQTRSSLKFSVCLLYRFDGSNFVKNLEASVADRKKKGKPPRRIRIFITVNGHMLC